MGKKITNYFVLYLEYSERFFYILCNVFDNIQAYVQALTLGVPDACNGKTKQKMCISVNAI